MNCALPRRTNKLLKNKLTLAVVLRLLNLEGIIGPGTVVFKISSDYVYFQATGFEGHD